MNVLKSIMRTVASDAGRFSVVYTLVREME